MDSEDNKSEGSLEAEEIRKEIDELKAIISNLDAAEIIGNKDIYGRIYSPSRDPFDLTELEVALYSRAKELKVITPVKNLCKEMKDGWKDQQKKLKKTSLPATVQKAANVTHFASDYAGKEYPIMACGQWFAGEGGIFTSDPSQPVQQIVCYHPIIPVKVLTNMQTGTQRVTVAYKNNGLWREITVPRRMIVASKNIIELADYGVNVTSETGKNLVKYLSDVENLNLDIIQQQQSTTKMGWHGMQKFVPYDKDIVFDGEANFQQLFSSIDSKGFLSKWIDCAKSLRASENLVARLAIAASFASVLIEPLDASPFIIDFHGETGGGKTVTLMLAASIWADPDIGGGFLTNLKSTTVNLEARSDMLNNLPVLLDDTSHADRRIMENYESIVYDLCSGMGKGRSNKNLGTERQRSWKNTIISNGEKPLSYYVSQGGAINRLIEIECNDDIFDNPTEIVRIVKNNYGAAGKRFVDYMKESISLESIKETWKEYEKQLTNDQSMQKQVDAMAVLLTADALATEAVFKDGKNLKPDDVAFLLTRKEDVSDNQRCYQYLLDVLGESPTRFDGESPIDQYGFYDPERKDVVFFYPHAFEKLLEKESYSRKAFTSWAKKAGLLMWSEQKGRPDIDTYVYRKKGINSIIRCIALKIQHEDMSETVQENTADNPASFEQSQFIPYDDGDLPFD